MAEAVSRRPFPKQTVIRCRASSRETCGDHSGTETVFSLSIYFGCPPPVAFQQYYILIFLLLLLLPQGKAGEAWEHSTKAMPFRIWRAMDRKVLSRCLYLNGWLKKKLG